MRSGGHVVWTRRILGPAVAGAAGLLVAVAAIAQTPPRHPAALRVAALKQEGPNPAWAPYQEFANPFGRVGLITSGPPQDMKDHPFFRPQANGRACVTCHQPQDAMGLSLETIRRHWAANGANDPLFAAVDGSNCPSLPQGERASHSLLLDRGLIRVRLPWPPYAPDGVTPTEPAFKLEVVSDPTGCNTSAEHGLSSKTPTVSVFRRPRMIANVRFVETPKYDYSAKDMLPMVRDPETHAPSSMSMMADGRAISLKWQTVDALRAHMNVSTPTSQQDLDRLLQFQRSIHLAQAWSNGAGDLSEPGGPKALGPKAMATGQSHINGNDLDTGIFFKMDQWAPGGAMQGSTADQKAFRASVARGYDIFFKKPFWISDTYGINNIRVGNPMKQTCGFCHNTQLTGHDNVPGWMDLGTTNAPHANPAPDLPLFRVTCKPNANPHPYLGRVIYTNDPGRALISGRCEDVGGIVMQQFRGVAARAPYFANGSAKSLSEVIDFYDRRFDIGLTDQERTDLVNFLSVL